MIKLLFEACFYFRALTRVTQERTLCLPVPHCKNLYKLLVQQSGHLKISFTFWYILDLEFKFCDHSSKSSLVIKNFLF